MTARQRPDYGIDAPGLCRGFVLGGAAALVVAVGVFALAPYTGLAIGVAALAGITAVYLLGMGSLMFWWSRVKKVHDRERLLDQLVWRGDERVLDIGCGRGLMLVGAARRLTSGRAIGIDIWNSADQSANTPDAAMVNAAIEGVADRVEVLTADMRAIDLPDAAIDVVVSHWAVHNLPEADDRRRALAEMARLLAPGGTIVLADIACRDEYARVLTVLGFGDRRIIAPAWRDALLGAISFGSFRPGAIVARRG